MVWEGVLAARKVAVTLIPGHLVFSLQPFLPRRILLLVPPFLFLKSLFLLSNMSTSGVLVLLWGGPHLCSRYVVWCPHLSAVHFVCILPPLPFSVSASLSFHLCALCLRKPVSVCHCFSWFPSQEGGLRGLECG